jgi:hypothetical protein
MYSVAKWATILFAWRVALAHPGFRPTPSNLIARISSSEEDPQGIGGREDIWRGKRPAESQPVDLQLSLSRGGNHQINSADCIDSQGNQGVNSEGFLFSSLEKRKKIGDIDSGQIRSNPSCAPHPFYTSDSVMYPAQAGTGDYENSK